MIHLYLKCPFISEMSSRLVLLALVVDSFLGCLWKFINLEMLLFLGTCSTPNPEAWSCILREQWFSTGVTPFHLHNMDVLIMLKTGKKFFLAFYKKERDWLNFIKCGILLSWHFAWIFCLYGISSFTYFKNLAFLEQNLVFNESLEVLL